MLFLTMERQCAGSENLFLHRFVDECLGGREVLAILYHTAVVNNGKLMSAASHRNGSNHVLIIPILANNKPWRPWFSIQDRWVFVLKKLQVK